MDNKKVWFVTGASKGLGLALCRQLLAAGHMVAATSRNADALVKATGAGNSARFLPLEMALTNEAEVAKAVSDTIKTFGAIDVVVNNAGYGQFGTLEELSDEEARRNFDINVFGALNVIRHVMPYFREQGSGHIFNIASIGGYASNFPGWGIYCATKYAMAGFTGALAAEGRPFGIHATVVYPGYFRTSFLSDDSMAGPAHPIAEYEEARASEALHRHNIDGNQPGDPEKAMRVLIQVASEAHPPLHLFLGKDAYEMAGIATDAVYKDLEAWKELTFSTSFADNSVRIPSMQD
jgi:NAD(P)-dependent dehydrogenase (short-subunit alcohol dehydrogenase family)